MKKKKGTMTTKMFQAMNKKKQHRGQAQAQYAAQLAEKVLQERLETGTDPFARAFRRRHRRQEEELFPNTELCVDLKFLSPTPERMLTGQSRKGMLFKDGEEHFTFLESCNEPGTPQPARRNERVRRGRFVNLNRGEDGLLRPSFNRPPYTRTFTPTDFLRGAAKELLLYASLLEGNPDGDAACFSCFSFS